MVEFSAFAIMNIATYLPTFLEFQIDCGLHAISAAVKGSPQRDFIQTFRIDTDKVGRQIINTVCNDLSIINRQ